VRWFAHGGTVSLDCRRRHFGISLASAPHPPSPVTRHPSCLFYPFWFELLSQRYANSKPHMHFDRHNGHPTRYPRQDANCRQWWFSTDLGCGHRIQKLYRSKGRCLHLAPQLNSVSLQACNRLMFLYVVVLVRVMVCDGV
jgi:hypothetical protein